MKKLLPIDELEALANENVGEALHQTRLHYGQSLEDVEEALRIRSCQIIAIEQGDIRKLPGKVYAIGFVRSYAEHLGLDGDLAVGLFKDQYMSSQASNTILSFPVPAQEVTTPSISIVVFSSLISILFFFGWYSISYSNNSAINSPVLQILPIPDKIKDHVTRDIMPTALDLPAVKPLSVDTPVENMGDEEVQKTGIILNIIDNSWVEVKNNKGEVIVSDFLEKGDQYFVPDNPGLSMSLGNAANVEIVIDGLALKPLGKDGDVRRDIPLNTTYLKTLEFK